MQPNAYQLYLILTQAGVTRLPNGCHLSLSVVERAFPTAPPTAPVLADDHCEFTPNCR